MSEVNQDVFARIKKVIEAELGKKNEEIRLEDRFQEDYGADSLDLVQFVMTLEDEFGIDIPDDDVEQIRSVKDAVEYISKKIEETVA
jgi:acyl carrier protein